MKNYEKYRDEIKNFDINKNFCDEFVLPYILNTSDCSKVHCDACRLRQTVWLFEEYEEPEEFTVDWNNVKIDTPILVRGSEKEEWEKRFFAKYEYGFVFAWDFGRMSWNENQMIPWKYAKLPKESKK